MNEFSVGNTLSLGFRIWFKNLPAFLLITVLIYTPFLLWGIVAASDPGESFERLLTFGRFSAPAMMVLNTFVASALCYGVVMELQGQHAGVGTCIATGLARFFPVLGVAMLSAIATVGGFLLLVIPGLIVMCMLYVSTVVAVLERPGVMASLHRSRELTAGRRWGVFGVLFVVGLVNFGLEKLVQVVMFDESKLTPENVHRMVRNYIYVDLGHTVVVGSIGAVMSAVAYYLLRSEKEGTSASELASVFE